MEPDEAMPLGDENAPGPPKKSLATGVDLGGLVRGREGEEELSTGKKMSGEEEWWWGPQTSPSPPYPPHMTLQPEGLAVGFGTLPPEPLAVGPFPRQPAQTVVSRRERPYR